MKTAAKSTTRRAKKQSATEPTEAPDACLDCGHASCPIYPDCAKCKACARERESAGSDAKIEEYERTVGAGVHALELARLRLDGGTQPRAAIDPNVVDEYAAAYRSGATLPPVVAFYDGSAHWLADGFHRVSALRELERAEVAVDVRQGTRRDAVLFSCSANASHGVRRTNADKRRAVLVLLGDEEWSLRSDRWIASQCAVDPSTVGVYRREFAAGAPAVGGGQVSDSYTSAQPAYREGQDGKRYPVASRGRPEVDPSGIQVDPSGIQVTPHGSSGEPGFGRDASAAPVPDPLTVHPVVSWRAHLGVPAGATNATVVEVYGKRLETVGDDERARAALDYAKGVGLSQWETHPALALQMAELALGGHEHEPVSVLEPSAGVGTLVEAARKVCPRAHITAHEIDPSRRPAILRAGADVIHIGDFFEWNPPSRPYDVAIQNTPYEAGLDGRFLERAMASAKRVVALLRTNALHGTDRFERVWSRVEACAWRLHDLVYLSARPEFAGPVDGTARSDFVVVHLVHESVARYSMTRVAWW